MGLFTGFSINPNGYGGGSLQSLGIDPSKHAVNNNYGLADYVDPSMTTANINGQAHKVEVDPSTGQIKLYDPSNQQAGAYLYDSKGNFQNWAPYTATPSWAQDVGTFALSAAAMGYGLNSMGFTGGEGVAGGFGAGGASASPVYGGSATGTDLGAAGAGGFGGDATAWGYGGAPDAMGSTSAASMGTGGAAGGAPSWMSKVTGALGMGGSGGNTGGGVADSSSSWQDGLFKAGLSGLGGYLNQQSASGAAGSAAAGAQFRPVGVTSRFGGSGFQFDANGNLVGAGYNLSPDAAALRDRMMGGTSQDLGAADKVSGAADGLFGLGQKYISGDPAADWMARQQKVLAPARQQALSKVRNDLYSTGRMGLATGGTDTMAASNPELQAYYNSIQQQDAQLAAQAEQQGRDSVTFGTGLFKNGMDLMNGRYAPALSSAAGANTIEGYGQDTLNMGAQLGGRAAQAGSNAAPWQYKANATSPWGAALQGAGSSNINWGSVYNGVKGLWT